MVTNYCVVIEFRKNLIESPGLSGLAKHLNIPSGKEYFIIFFILVRD